MGSQQQGAAQRRSSETPTDPVDGASSAMSARIAGQSARHRAQLCQWRCPRAWPRPRSRVTGHCTSDDYSDDCRESTVRVCAEVDTWAIVDRSGLLRADSYHLPTVCNAATIGSSHKRRWSDRRHQLAYRGAASGLLMACEARYSGRSESDMASLGPALSATIPG